MLSRPLAVTLRGLTLGELKPGAERALVMKEGLLGFLNGSFTGLVAGLGMFAYATMTGSKHALMLGGVVWLALVGACVVSGICGALIPLTLKRMGLDPATALARHALKVAILPVITYLGPMAAYVLTGSFVVESIFNISGVGSVFVNSIQNRDCFLLTGAVIVYSALIVLFNFIVDVLYGVIDPRIRLT